MLRSPKILYPLPFYNFIFYRVAECAIFFSGLNIVAFFTGRSPVAFIPEKLVIAAMRYEVVDKSGSSNDRRFLLKTIEAERMLNQEEPAGLAPSVVIATLIGATALLIITSAFLLEMLLAVAAFMFG
jgi:hypothetical protein